MDTAAARHEKLLLLYGGKILFVEKHSGILYK